MWKQTFYWLFNGRTAQKFSWFICRTEERDTIFSVQAYLRKKCFSNKAISRWPLISTRSDRESSWRAAENDPAWEAGSRGEIKMILVIFLYIRELVVGPEWADRLCFDPTGVSGLCVPVTHSEVLPHPHPSAPLNSGGRTEIYSQCLLSILCQKCLVTRPNPQNPPVFGRGTGSCPGASAWCVRWSHSLPEHDVDVGTLEERLGSVSCMCIYQLVGQCTFLCCCLKICFSLSLCQNLDEDYVLEGLDLCGFFCCISSYCCWTCLSLKPIVYGVAVTSCDISLIWFKTHCFASKLLNHRKKDQRKRGWLASAATRPHWAL